PLLTPVILLWGIYGGVFTPTEAAAATVFYALILSVVGYRILGFKKLITIFKESALSTGYVSAMVAAALVFSYIVSREQLPIALTNWVMNSGIITNKYMYLLFVNIFLLFCHFSSLLLLSYLLLYLNYLYLSALILDNTYLLNQSCTSFYIPLPFAFS
ncbi:unnamed protein product, partial [marine sediment metagenome]